METRALSTIAIEWKQSLATKKGRMETILSNEERQQYFGADEKWKSVGHFDYYDEQGRENYYFFI
jgi:hypothetical protein